jgi:DNA polymerase-3 subunit beta
MMKTTVTEAAPVASTKIGFGCYKEDLLPALMLAKEVIEKRYAIPTLFRVRIKFDGALMAVIATDMDMTLRYPFPTTETPDVFDIVVNNDTLFKLVKNAPKGCEIRLEYDANEKLPTSKVKATTPGEKDTIEPTQGYALTVMVGSSRVSLNTPPVCDWQRTTFKGVVEASFNVMSAKFLANLKATSIAISTEETRPYLNGVYMYKQSDDMLVLVATDGYLLVKAEHEALPGVTMRGVIVPRKTVALWTKMLSAKHGPVSARIEVTDKLSTRLTVGNVLIESKPIDWTFPDHERVIPASYTTTLGVRFDVKELTAAIKQVTSISSDLGRVFKLEVCDDKLVRVSVENSDAGAMAVDVACVVVGEPNKGPAIGFEVGMSGNRTLELLRSLTAEEVWFRFAAPRAPMRIEPVGGGDLTIVQMPMLV